ncbi:MAG: hypothetical protein HEQ39_16225 [Rhizobacter sp.]
MVFVSSVRRLFFCGLLLASALVPGHAQSATVSLAASTTSPTAGSQFFVDVLVDGLSSGQVIGAFDLDVVFNSSVLSASSVAFSPALGSLGLEQLTASTITAGRIDFSSVSLLTGAELLPLQSGLFSLARFTFDAIGSGAAGLAFDALTAPGLLFGDEFGNALIVSVGTVSNVVVPGGGTVAEPGSLALVLLAVLACSAFTTVRRRA